MCFWMNIIIQMIHSRWTKSQIKNGVLIRSNRIKYWFGPAEWFSRTECPIRSNRMKSWFGRTEWNSDSVGPNEILIRSTEWNLDSVRPNDSVGLNDSVEPNETIEFASVHSVHSVKNLMTFYSKLKRFEWLLSSRPNRLGLTEFFFGCHP